MKIDKRLAERIFREAAEDPASSIDSGWVEKVQRLSELCAAGNTKTHIAFLGTAMLAKATNPNVDLFAIKPRHAPGNPKAFSARSLCHGVLVPLAAELGVSIGVTGREPLNNQPYFRMKWLGDETPVHRSGRKAFDYMMGLIKELNVLTDAGVAREALRAFIHVRRREQVTYQTLDGERCIAPSLLGHAIRRLVEENSEGGRRAQAALAGLLDIVAGADRVTCGRINDPSRRYPGDVCVRARSLWEPDPDVAVREGPPALSESPAWEKAIEVRDKPVSDADARIFARKCLEMGVREAAILMASEKQEPLDEDALVKWAEGNGMGIRLFYAWDQIAAEALFWSPNPMPTAAWEAACRIEARLIEAEASPEALICWRREIARISS